MTAEGLPYAANWASGLRQERLDSSQPAEQ
jgi:hypothetical protein